MCRQAAVSAHGWGSFTVQSVRDGIDEFRGNLAGTKSRIKEASNRINGSLGGFIEKKYW